MPLLPWTRGKPLTKQPDIENPIPLNYSKKRWTIDHHRSNIIEHVLAGTSQGTETASNLGKQPWSYRINFVELQRIRLRQLQRELVGHAVDIYFNIEEPEGWESKLRDYVQALQDYDYMGRHDNSVDPFIVTGERYVERCMLHEAMKKEPNAKDGLRKVGTLGFWEDSTSKPTPIGDTRAANRRQMFYSRVGVAAVAGAFLIGPMWLMVLHNTVYTGLVTTTVCVAVFGLIMAIRLNTSMEVLSSTAAYAAVLVVFVGLTTEGNSGGN
jgi:hypothetical protein